MSENTLDKLIATLKTEAIEAAEKEAAAIVEEARKQAAMILDKSRAESEKIVAGARDKADQTLVKGQSALRQAARDVTVSLQNDLMRLMGNVLDREVTTQFRPEVVATAIEQVLDNVGGGVELRLSPDLMEEIGARLLARLQQSDSLVAENEPGRLAKSVTIVKKDEGWSYHISPESVTELLKAELSESWLKLINKA